MRADALFRGCCCVAFCADWAKALIPRSATGAVATDMARSLGGPVECTAVAALLQAAMTVLFGAGAVLACNGGCWHGVDGLFAVHACWHTAGLMLLACCCGAGLLSQAFGGAKQQPAAAGAAAGATAGGIGVAAVSGGQPAALANGGLAYALVGIFSSLLVNVPAMKQALLALV